MRHQSFISSQRIFKQFATLKQDSPVLSVFPGCHHGIKLPPAMLRLCKTFTCSALIPKLRAATEDFILHETFNDCKRCAQIQHFYLKFVLIGLFRLSLFRLIAILHGNPEAMRHIPFPVMLAVQGSYNSQGF